MRELLGGATEDVRKPLDPFLMRHIHERVIAKDIRQAVRAGVRLRYLLRRPKVPPPRHICQRKENREDDRHHQNCCQKLFLNARDSYGLPTARRPPVFFILMVELVR